MQYKICHSLTIKGLGERVELFLNKGWELHGSIVVDNKVYYQVIVKKNDQ
jgi:hypothetical protein